MWLTKDREHKLPVIRRKCSLKRNLYGCIALKKKAKLFGIKGAFSKEIMSVKPARNSFTVPSAITWWARNCYTCDISTVSNRYRPALWRHEGCFYRSFVTDTWTERGNRKTLVCLPYSGTTPTLCLCWAVIFILSYQVEGQAFLRPWWRDSNLPLIPGCCKNWIRKCKDNCPTNVRNNEANRLFRWVLLLCNAQYWKQKQQKPSFIAQWCMVNSLKVKEGIGNLPHHRNNEKSNWETGLYGLQIKNGSKK